MWTIPDKGEGFSNIQSQVFQEYLDALIDGINGTNCVLSGCAVAAQGAPDATLAVAKGAVLTNGVLKAVAAANVNITAADASNPRIDLVVIDAAGAKQVRAGAPATNPKPPARTANDVIIAAVFVPANDNTIENDKVTDMRVMRTQGPITIAKINGPVTQGTLATIFTLLSQVIPNGLFLTGRSLRLQMGGNYLSNSGAPTWTFTISYGGTTMFADATAATTADADRGAWGIEFVLQAQANADQALSGSIRFQSPGAKNAPTSGQAGDLATVADVNSPIAGAAAVDSDAADRTLLVQCTMSVANVAVETVMEYATLELV